jgi:hypothetical protein
LGLLLLDDFQEVFAGLFEGRDLLFQVLFGFFAKHLQALELLILGLKLLAFFDGVVELQFCLLLVIFT